MTQQQSMTTQSTATHTWQICNERCLTLFLPKPVTLEQQQLCWGLAEKIPQLDDIKAWIKETVVGMNTLSVYTQDLTARQLLQLQYFLQIFIHTYWC